ncbi:MAG: hypothetical protein HC939_16470 [Pleurocapsa sp. SU_5_0]|nr:hypothetical protein [Pleurocapsa sp. SU_5_0]
MLDSFEKLIQQVDKIRDSEATDEIKLRRSGELICQYSGQLLQRTETLFEQIQHPEVELGDTIIDASFDSFLASMTQQSISTDFLAKYIQPQTRKSYQRETSTVFKFMSSSEAIAEFQEELQDLEISTLAHDENIHHWVKLVQEYLWNYSENNTLMEIARGTDLSLAQVFIAGLFGDFLLGFRRSLL